jgi:hypothetical protein
MSDKPKKTAGAPVKYMASTHPYIVQKLYEIGATDEMIAKSIGIRRETFFVWKKKYPELSNTAKAKAETDAKVVEALNKRCLGYDVFEEDVASAVDADGKPIGIRTIRRKKKHIPPDTLAMKFWLMNRQRKEWTERREIVLDNLEQHQSEMLQIAMASEEDDDD